MPKQATFPTVSLMENGERLTYNTPTGWMRLKRHKVFPRKEGAALSNNTGTSKFTPWNTLQFSLIAAAVEVGPVLDLQSYLDRHPNMVEVTGKICQATRQEFGPEASLVLQVYLDPEIADEYLLLRVRLPFYAPDTMRRIRAVSDPYESELGDASGAILVTSDFRPIR